MRRLGLILSLFALFLLAGCSAAASPEKIQASLVETDYFTVEENGLWLSPGENAVFFLGLRPDSAIVGVNYEGGYRLSAEGWRTRLELMNVLYPVRVSIDIVTREPAETAENEAPAPAAGKSEAAQEVERPRSFVTIAYDPNGGLGGGEHSYETTLHTRPNTSIWTDEFSREDYTLASWNTAPDGSGLRIGLGSRVTAPEEGLRLYAQWEKWTDEAAFIYEITGGEAKITGFSGAGAVCIPESLGGAAVTEIASGAFRGANIDSVIFPRTLKTVEDGAFSDSALSSVTLFDSIEYISDSAFSGCEELRTLYINAQEPPYGYSYRRESLYADKIDLLINAQGRKKLIFYGGCSAWYNLDGAAAKKAFGEEYEIINLGLNGTVSSLVQMLIMEPFLEEGDILFHTPELGSVQQLLIKTDMSVRNGLFRHLPRLPGEHLHGRDRLQSPPARVAARQRPDGRDKAQPRLPGRRPCPAVRDVPPLCGAGSYRLCELRGDKYAVRSPGGAGQRPRL